MPPTTNGGLLDAPALPAPSPSLTSNITTAHAYRPPLVLTAETLESLPTPLQPYREIIGLALDRALPERERKWRTHETKRQYAGVGEDGRPKFKETPESSGTQTEDPNEIIQIAVKGWYSARDSARAGIGDPAEWQRLGNQHLATLRYWQTELMEQYGASIPAAVALLKAYRAGAKEVTLRPKPKSEGTRQ